MSFPTNNNTFVMAPTSPNPYISQKLNNVDQARVMKREREDWSRLYHKMLKGIKAMIDVQRMIKDMKKIAEETSTTVTEMERTVLMASINNQTINATNVMQIAEDLRYLVQSNMDERAFQVQRMLADELDHYKEKGNEYVCYMQVPPIWKTTSRGDATSEPYKPAFHSGHLSRNTFYSGAATFWIFHLPRRRYSYSTQSSMTELLLSVSQH